MWVRGDGKRGDMATNQGPQMLEDKVGPCPRAKATNPTLILDFWPQRWENELVQPEVLALCWYSHRNELG